MKKIAGKTLATLGMMGLVALGAGPVSADTYTGTLTSADGGITGTSAWADNLTLTWTVDTRRTRGSGRTPRFRQRTPGSRMS